MWCSIFDVKDNVEKLWNDTKWYDNYAKIGDIKVTLKNWRPDMKFRKFFKQCMLHRKKLKCRSVCTVI